MCLDTIDAKTRKVKYGYKVYYKYHDGGLIGVFYTPSKLHRYLVDEWIKDGYTFDLWDAERNGTYPAGFHVSTNKKSAKIMVGSEHSYPIHKVLVKDIVASGTQDGHNVVVCRQKKILPGEIK